MSILTRNLLSVAVLATLAIGVAIKTVQANQTLPPVPVISQSQPNNQEISDGDGEANEATEPKEEAKKGQTKEDDQNEGDEGSNDSDSTHEDD